MIKKKITANPYNYDITFIFNDTPENEEVINTLLSKHSIYITESESDDWVDSAKGWTLKNEEETIIIINIHRHKTKDSLLVTLRHEIHHACANCFKYICNPITILDEEVFLYLNDWVFMQAIDIVNKNKILQ